MNGMTTRQRTKSKPAHYFLHLCTLVEPYDEHNLPLLRHLHDAVFIPLIPNDDNREADGIQLREEFLDEEGPQALSSNFLKKPCSMLEMLIALSRRLEWESSGETWEQPASEWFWVLLDNLGLGDQKYDKNRTDEILDIFVQRTYKRNGEGGLFPMRRNRKDQRKREIWYQMNDWVVENYDEGW